VLAAIGLRTAFDRASELLGIDPNKTFAGKLSQLVVDGHIGSTEKASLDVLTDAGGAAAHRGWKTQSKATGHAIVHHGAVCPQDVCVERKSEKGQDVYSISEEALEIAVRRFVLPRPIGIATTA
jgi:Domain of unknown function (DUF4145)